MNEFSRRQRAFNREEPSEPDQAVQDFEAEGAPAQPADEPQQERRGRATIEAAPAGIPEPDPAPARQEPQDIPVTRSTVQEANLQNTIRDTDAADAEETVTVRYTGSRESFDTRGLGVYEAGKDYEVNPRCARRLLELRNPDGTKAFEEV